MSMLVEVIAGDLGMGGPIRRKLQHMAAEQMENRWLLPLGRGIAPAAPQLKAVYPTFKSPAAVPSM